MSKQSMQLRRATMMRIVEFRLAHKDFTMQMVCDKLGCTMAQLQYALEKHKKGLLQRDQTARAKMNAAREIVGEINIADDFEEQIKIILAQLKTDNMAAGERAQVLDRIAYMMKNLQSMRLEAHIKRTDADIIKLIILKFMPDATDEEVIKIYKEAYEKWKHQS